MYTRLGAAPAVPAVAKISLDIGAKLSALFGKQHERVAARIKEITAKYNAAVNGDITALEWLYVKSGGRDSHTATKIDLGRIKGWRPQDVPGSVGSAGLVAAVSLAAQLRILSYDLYAEAAQAQGKEPLPPNPKLTQPYLNIGMSPTTGEKLVPTVETLLAPAKQAAEAAKVQQAGFLGMDISNPTTLASLGLIALAFILRER